MERLILKSLQSWKANKYRKPLLLRGLRQCGKTHILNTFGQRAFPRVHYVNFEETQKLSQLFENDLKPTDIISALSFELQCEIDVQQDLVIFDEIQACPRALTSLKYFCEKMPELALACAGSLLGISLNSDSYPVGKVDDLTLHPMTFQEFLMALHEDRALAALETLKSGHEVPPNVHEYLWTKLKWYFVVGGMPEVVLMFRENQEILFTAFNIVREKQQELLRAYDSDIAKHAGKVNAMHISRVFRAAATQLALVQHDGAKRFKFTGVVPGIDRYQRLVGAIDWLERANLILRTSITSRVELPLAAFCKESLFKMYLCDIGLLGAITELNPHLILDYQYGTYKGYFAENFVAQELTAQSPQTLYCWQENKSEVEFLRMIGREVIPIEVKAGNITRAKSLENFVGKYHSTRQIILSAQPLDYSPDKGTMRLPIYLAGFIDQMA